MKRSKFDVLKIKTNNAALIWKDVHGIAPDAAAITNHKSEVKFTSLLLCIKPVQNPFLTPMRSIGQTSENSSVYAPFRRFALK